MGMTGSLIADGVDVTRDGTPILHGVSLEVVPGEVLAIVGPNGAGKSTVLAALSGDIRADRGTVRIGERALSTMSHLELAQNRSVLTQDNQLSFPFTVRQVTVMGRSPWVRTSQSADDDEAVAAAMAATDVTHLADRRFTSLSGGEKARVSLARVLAQRSPIVLLDEPTAALDLRHQEEVMRIVRSLATDGFAVLVVVHDLSLAAAYADRIAMMAAGRVVALGSPREVLTADRVGSVYGLPVAVTHENGHPVVVPVRTVGA
jgi:iron complex transport system ATP-binding protein